MCKTLIWLTVLCVCGYARQLLKAVNGHILLTDQSAVHSAVKDIQMCISVLSLAPSLQTPPAFLFSLSLSLSLHLSLDVSLRRNLRKLGRGYTFLPFSFSALTPPPDRECFARWKRKAIAVIATTLLVVARQQFIWNLKCSANLLPGLLYVAQTVVVITCKVNQLHVQYPKEPTQVCRGEWDWLSYFLLLCVYTLNNTF